MGQASGTTFTAALPSKPPVPLSSDMWDGPGMASLGHMTRIWFLFLQSLIADGIGKYVTSWTAQTTVTVTHGLASTDVGWFVYDAAGVAVQPVSVTVTSPDVVTLTFSGAFTGRVVIIA